MFDRPYKPNWDSSGIADGTGVVDPAEPTEPTEPTGPAVSAELHSSFSGLVKLVDFGFARSGYSPYRNTPFRKMQNLFSQTCCGTFTYSSPELLSSAGSAPYNPQMNDLWGLGVVLYEMLSGRLPWTDSDPKRLARLQRAGLVWPEQQKPTPARTDQARDLVIGILQYNIPERFILKDILYHPWIYYEFLRYESSRMGLLAQVPQEPIESNPLNLKTNIIYGKVFRMWGDDYLVRNYRMTLDTANRALFYNNMYRKLQQGLEIGADPAGDADCLAGLLRSRGEKEGLQAVQRMARRIREWDTAFSRVNKVPRNPNDQDNIYRVNNVPRDPTNTETSADLKSQLVRGVECLYNIQQTGIKNASVVQDAMTLLQAAVYRAGCPDWTAVFKQCVLCLWQAVSLLKPIIKEVSAKAKGNIQVGTKNFIAKNIEAYEKCGPILEGLLENLQSALQEMNPFFAEEVKFRYFQSRSESSEIDPAVLHSIQIPFGHSMFQGFDGLQRNSFQEYMEMSELSKMCQSVSVELGQSAACEQSEPTSSVQQSRESPASGLSADPSSFQSTHLPPRNDTQIDFDLAGSPTSQRATEPHPFDTRPASLCLTRDSAADHVREEFAGAATRPTETRAEKATTRESSPTEDF